MDSKTLSVLEFPKILARLADFCDFSGSANLARSLQPTTDYEEAVARLNETSEARKLLVMTDVTIGGAHDIREQVELAARGGVLDPTEMLDVQSTLISMRTLHRFFEKHLEEYPNLAGIAYRLPAPQGLIEAISRCITDTGEVADSASPKLYDLRRQVRVAHDRLMTRLQRYLTDATTAPKLQDAVIDLEDLSSGVSIVNAADGVAVEDLPGREDHRPQGAHRDRRKRDARKVRDNVFVRAFWF